MMPEHFSYQQKHQSVSDIRPATQPRSFSWPPEPLQQPSDIFVKEEELAAYGPQDIHEAPMVALPKERLQQRPPSEIRSARMSAGRKMAVFLAVAALLSGLAWIAFRKASAVQDIVVSDSERGFNDLMLAENSLKAEQYGVSLDRFNDAYSAFSQAEEHLTVLGRVLADVSGFIPAFSKASSGKHAIEAGKHFAAAGIPLSRIAADMSQSKDSYIKGEKISLLDLISRIKEPLSGAASELEQADQDLQSVNMEDIPADKRDKFLMVRQGLPVALGFFKSLNQEEPLINELLGGNGPRKYLFLLQNNDEMRATGGFIGSYGLLSVNDGVVQKFFVDGIFNPDGQLRENIVPPKPIQKISATWSLHDSNWWPDFPTSAEKAIFFYEKTGGPTVDGVIALTPTVMQKLLAVTGPITLPQYGLTVDADNFIPVVQEQVEVKYDKTENKPKKILADLSSMLLEKVFASQDKETLVRMIQALVDGLNEKQMLLYMRYPETEALIDGAGWSGKVLDAKKDYLSVVHTNINGYKTDGVIDESIKHKAEIQDDGSVIDTVAITRTHHGGDTPYDWWNRVNADYLRVYVPKGSELLSAKGATWEFPKAPLDYDRLGFKRDPDVEREESRMIIDEKSGTRISEDAGKTVFGAWVYVSPKESVTVEYRYKLPFRLDISKPDASDSYSCVYQKQSGSIGSKLLTAIDFPANLDLIWQTGPNLVRYGQELRSEEDLKTDKFSGAVFRLQE